MASAHPELRPVLPDEVTISRTFWLLMHADSKDLARIRAVADYIYETVESERALFSDDDSQFGFARAFFATGIAAAERRARLRGPRKISSENSPLPAMRDNTIVPIMVARTPIACLRADLRGTSRI